MDFLLILVVLFIAIYFVLKKVKSIRKSDSLIISKEIEKDFEEEFEHDASGQLTEKGMTNLVVWCEDDLFKRKVSQAHEIDEFVEIN